jgi:LysM repeat protein
MKTPGVIGIVAGAHVVAVAGVMMIQGCGTTRSAAPAPGEVVMPPSAVAPAPAPIKPVPTPPAVTQWPAETTEYVVRAGDSLSRIASRFGLNTRELAALNGIDDANKIVVGQKLKLPGKVDVGAPPAAAKPAAAAPAAAAGTAGVYVVKAGDCLSKVAAAHGCTTRQLMEANGLQSEKILVGQKLKIPAGGRAPAAPAAAAAAKPAAAKAPAPAAVPGLDAAPVDALPAEAPAPALDAGLGMRTHVVADGEDLHAVAMMYNVSVNRLMELNGLSGFDLKAGQKLRIPMAE